MTPSPARSRPALATSTRNGSAFWASFLSWRRNAAVERHRSQRQGHLWDEGGRWIRASGLWAGMAESTVQQDTITCNPATSSCEKAGEWQCALGRTTQRDTILSQAAISAFVKACARRFSLRRLRQNRVERFRTCGQRWTWKLGREFQEC